jgi:anti-sigma regulatory factor (Ser/Thr protein kinase)
VVCVALFSFLLIRPLGITAVYIANVLNGVVTVAFIVFYSWHVRRKMPKTMAELMVIPDDFGAGEDERLDLSIRSLEEVVSVSQRVQSFCLEKGIDKKRAYLASLSMEEMAGNIVEHGFTKDTKDHSVDIRVVHKNDKVILRIKDDCVPFDPKERSQIVDNEDPTKNIGIRMIYKIMKDITYQNILGLNVLTITV